MPPNVLQAYEHVCNRCSEIAAEVLQESADSRAVIDLRVSFCCTCAGLCSRSQPALPPDHPVPEDWQVVEARPHTVVHRRSFHEFSCVVAVLLLQFSGSSPTARFLMVLALTGPPVVAAWLAPTPTNHPIGQARLAAGEEELQALRGVLAGAEDAGGFLRAYRHPPALAPELAGLGLAAGAWPADMNDVFKQCVAGLGTLCLAPIGS
jgi:hypothetical protein